MSLTLRQRARLVEVLAELLKALSRYTLPEPHTIEIAIQIAPQEGAGGRVFSASAIVDANTLEIDRATFTDIH